MYIRYVIRILKKTAGCRTYDCGWKEGMTTEEVRDFSQEMIAVHGRFAEEAGDILEGLVEEFPDKREYRDLLEKAGIIVKKWYEGWKG